MHTIKIILLTISFVVAAQTSVHADLYKYQLSDGTIHITSDSSTIPPDHAEKSRILETENKETNQQVPDNQPAAQAGRSFRADRKHGKRVSVAEPLSNDTWREDLEQQEREKQRAKEKDDRETFMRAKYPPDSRYSSPETTWSSYQQALISGNLEAAVECFLPSSMARYRETFTALGRDKMQDIGKNMKAIQQITGDGDHAKYRIRRDVDGREITFYIYFNRLGNLWKIESY